ncbi:MAG: hypothetical protein K0Q95_3243, partial [Bacteroidota bacterium]|nr:hypothetical protein [Bacteroidota bacterium]
FSGGGSAGTFTSTAGLSLNATTGVVNLAASTPGTYTVTNTKAAAGGCPQVIATSTITISAPAVATFSYTGTPYCKSSTNPSPTFSGGGSAGTFTSTAGLVINSTTGVVNLAASTAGTYTVTNTKPAAGGCPVITATSSITILSGPTAQAVSTTNTGCGASTGTITIGVTTGGTGPYSYSVNGSGFTSTTTYTGLASGSYPVIVKDANGCQFSTTATVSNSSGPTAQAVITSSSTCGNANGGITIGTTTGGTGPYTYSVNGSGFTATTSYTGLAAGAYPVIVKDAGGCQFTTSATITNIAGPSSTATSTAATCGNSNGSAGVNVTGGTPGYTYLWTPTGGASATLTNVIAGTYTVIVTDNNGCNSTAVTTVANIAGPTAQATSTSNATCGGTNGTISIGATSGGTSPFMYSVDGSAASTTTVYNGFAAGSYPVIVTDANGCMFSTSVTVGNTGTIPSTPTITQSGSTLTSSSATGNQWYNNGVAMPGETGQTFTFTANGNYTVIVTNGGCSSASSAVMSVTNVGIAESGKDPYSFLIYPNPNDGHFTLSFFANDRSTYRVEIVNALGQAVFKADLIDFSGNYKKEMSVVEYGQGIYTISLTNSTNETVRKIIVY